MLLALAIAAVTLVVVATVVLPLMKGARAAPGRASFDRAVYRDQLKELERDRARARACPGRRRRPPWRHRRRLGRTREGSRGESRRCREMAPAGAQRGDARAMAEERHCLPESLGAHQESPRRRLGLW